jgi:hypothetical protein
MIPKEGRRRPIQRYKLDGYQPASITKSAGKGKKKRKKREKGIDTFITYPQKRNLLSRLFLSSNEHLTLPYLYLYLMDNLT